MHACRHTVDHTLHACAYSVPVSVLQDWEKASVQLMVPKTTSTVITDVTIENLVRDSITTTALVPAADVAKQGYKAATAKGTLLGMHGALM